MVVSIHTYTSEDSIELRQVMNTAVPLFIAISGFFLSRKPIERKEQYVNFLKKQVAKVYIPTMLWSLPWFIWAIGSGGNVVLNMIRLFVCDFSIYYFIAYIIQCYIALPVVLSIVKKCYLGGVILSILISLAWIGTMVYYMVIKGISLPLVIYAGVLPCWIMFFVLGVVLGMRNGREYFLWMPLSITVLGFAISVISSTYLHAVYHGGYGIKPSSFVYAFGAILFLFNKRVETLVSSHRNMIFRSMVWLGNISFAVYLIHIYMINLVVNHFTIDSWFLRTFFALLLTVLFIVILKRLIPERLQKYIGI